MADVTMMGYPVKVTITRGDREIEVVPDYDCTRQTPVISVTPNRVLEAVRADDAQIKAEDAVAAKLEPRLAAIERQMAWYRRERYAESLTRKR